MAISTKAHSRYILIVVFVAGASVMMLEILGTRVIGPYYGVNIYVWSALIGVTLSFLSLGYYFGGWIADRKPEITVLSWFIFLAAILVLSIPLTSLSVVRVCQGLGLRGGALVSSLVLFSPCMFLFGTVVPLSVKLTSTNLKTLGVTAGRVYAVSTLGGLLGTVLTGFFLIPNFQLSSIFLIVAALLFFLSFLGYFFQKRFVIAGLAIAVAVVTILAFLLGLRFVKKDSSKTVYHTQSIYGDLKVVEDDMTRFLLIDGMVHTALPKDEKVLNNTDYLLSENFYPVLLPLCRPEGERALLIGLGGGLIWKILSIRGVNVKSVEIDSKVVDIARKFFDFDGEIYIGDGRYYIQATDTKYDFVIIDAYSSDEIPSHLFTRECFLSVSNILSPDGILCINCIGFPYAMVTISLFKTLKSIFPYTDLYRTEPYEGVQSMFFFASKKPLPLENIFAMNDKERFRLLDKQRIRYGGSEGIIITDDYNPVDLWWSNTSVAWRSKTMEILKMF